MAEHTVKRAHRVPLNWQTGRLFVRMVKNLFSSEVGTTATLLFVALIALLLMINGLNVVNSYVGRDFMTAISQRDEAGFTRYALFYVGVFAASTMVDVIYGFTVGRLGLLWRVWLTQNFVVAYLGKRAYYHLNATASISNPDQRITEDVRTLATATLTFVLLMLNGSFTIMAFAGVLWSISPLLFGVAVGYAAVGSLLTVLLGRPLIWLNYNQSDKEAVFRADLVHVGQNAEWIALAHREGLLRHRLLRHLDELAANFKRIIAVSRNLGFFTTGYNYMIQIIPALIVAPIFIRGDCEFGVITQAAMAFSQLLGAFSLIITQFQSISSYAAVLSRLASLAEAIEKVEPEKRSAIDLVEADDRVQYDRLTLRAGEGASPLIKDLSLSVPDGTRCLILGPDDAAKMALFRATAGIKDHGEGRIVRPTLGQILFLPERPYLPPGTMRELLRSSDQTEEGQILGVVGAFELDDVILRAGGLDVEHDWDDLLSLGEQHLVALARVALASPRFAFVDRISNALSPEQIEKILKLLSDRSITYLTLGGAEDRYDHYDAVLQILHDGSWELRLIRTDAPPSGGHTEN